jgi:hypothetical protein
MPHHLSRRRFIINLPKIRSVVADAGNPGGDDKLVLLRVQHEGASKSDPTNAGTDTRPSALADLGADARSYLKTQNAFLTTYNIELGYDYWTAGSLDTRPRECLTQVVTPYRGDSARNFSGGTPGRLPHWVFDYGAPG